MIQYAGNKNLVYIYREIANKTKRIMERRIIMSKIKADKKTVLTVLSAVFGVGGFVVNVLSSKDETEEIAQRAAEIIREKQMEEEES